jgi:flagellar basal body L-ring protein FlgH
LLEKSTTGKQAGGSKGDAKVASNDGAKDSGKDEIKQSSAAPDEKGNLSFSQVDLKEAIGAKAGDTFLAEVIERFPNGNYKIRGTKRLPFRGGSKLMTLVGVVRGNDLSDDDKVNSGRLYEYRLEVVR